MIADSICATKILRSETSIWLVTFSRLVSKIYILLVPLTDVRHKVQRVTRYPLLLKQVSISYFNLTLVLTAAFYCRLKNTLKSERSTKASKPRMLWRVNSLNTSTRPSDIRKDRRRWRIFHRISGLGRGTWYEPSSPRSECSSTSITLTSDVWISQLQRATWVREHCSERASCSRRRVGKSWTLSCAATFWCCWMSRWRTCIAW